MTESALDNAFAPDVATSPKDVDASFAFSISFEVLDESLLNFSRSCSYSLILLFAFVSRSLISAFVESTESEMLNTEFFKISAIVSDATEENVLLTCVWIVLAPELVIFGAIALSFSLI